ncbi:MAG: hypothetical protein GC189_01625 [Alphaproteobacteria bacterium]|nr:hypothetical protein [Alphaproteobacteria bacterium]
MRRAIAAALIASTMLAGLSAASAQPSASEAETQRSMDAMHIAVPVVQNGRLVSYIFASVRVDIAGGVDLWRTREKAHFLRDALIQAAHQAPLTDPANMDALNRPAAIAAFRRAAEQTLGPRAVRGVSIISTQSSRQSAAQY